MANALAEDQEVDVVCMEREEGGIIAYQEDPSLEQAIHPEITVHRVRAANWWKMNMALYLVGIFPCYFINWAWSVWRKKDDIFLQRGVVFAVYPVFSDLLVGYLISRRYKMPLIIDFRDDFSGVMARGWRKFFGPFYRAIERRFVRYAEEISVTTEHLRKDIIRRYGLSDAKVKVVYNIVPPVEPSIDDRGSVPDEILVVYAGAMSQVQKPEILLRAHQELLAENPPWRGRVCVELYGPESPYFKLRIKQFLGEGRIFGGFLPQNEVSRRVASADIGFLSLADATYAYATPTKLFDYIEAGIPILASLPQGAARDIILKYEIGLVVDVGDVKGMAHGLKTLAENSTLCAHFRSNTEKAKEELKASRQIDIWSDMIARVRNTLD